MFLIGAVPILFLLVSLLVLWLVTHAARPVSYVLSWVLNATTWSQLRARCLGVDVLGEKAVGASAAPKGFSRCFAALPDDLARDLSAVSDAAAARSVPRLREAIRKFAFAGESSERGVLAEYLTWRELIHTTYFLLRRAERSQFDGLCDQRC